MQRLRRVLLVLALVVVVVGAWLVRQDSGDGDGDGVTTGDEAPVEAGESRQSGGPVVGDAATVRVVHDGDSFVAEPDAGGEVDVRMIGINAPELGECLYREAKAALTGLVGEGAIGLERDVTDRDRYRRALRYVHAGGVLANVVLVERGLALAVSTDPDTAHAAELLAAQDRASAAGLGIWDPDACGPAASRAVQIVEVSADPRDRDDEDLNGEYVVVRNSGPTPVDMTGWKLRDDSTQNRFWFPAGFTLAGGRQVTVHVGRGDDRDDALFWGRRYPVWDNFGDMALLLDPAGNAVSVVDVAPTR